MTECTTKESQVAFSFFGPQKVTAKFSDGAVTSNAGLALIAELDRKTGWTERLHSGIVDYRRRPELATHSLQDLLRQRVYQVACGYEDANDADGLRYDPLLKAACGRHPEKGSALGSQPTFSRFENSIDEASIENMNDAFVEHYIARREGREPVKFIVLDIDSSCDPTHGQQEFAAFHGFYSSHMYHPLFVFDGETGELLAARLRPGRAGASEGASEILTPIIEKFRKRWPKVRIHLRADSGFSSPQFHEFLDAKEVDFTIGISPNSVLNKLAEELIVRARQQYESEGKKARLFDAASYQAGNWKKHRLVVMKAEYDALGSNVRFVTSTNLGPPPNVYDFYCLRGQAENFIKELKNGICFDRLSCSRFRANKVRLVLYCAAYVLLWELRNHLAGTDLHRAQFNTIRLRLIKIGARVVTSARRVWMYMTSSCPDKKTWLLLAGRLGAAGQ